MFDSGEGEIVEVILHEDAVAHGDIMDIDEAEGGDGDEEPEVALTELICCYSLLEAVSIKCLKT